MKHFTPKRLATAAVVGLALDALSPYLLSECAHKERPVQAKKAEYHPETVTVHIAYNQQHKVGGFKLQYSQKEDFVLAQLSFRQKSGEVMTGMKLREGTPASMEIREKGLNLTAELIGHDDFMVYVKISVTKK